MSQVRVRFAPSPTGYLHVGNVRTALYNWLFARQQRGAFILRIEDTDAERSAREYEDRLVSDLRWLGLEWDEGPDRVGACGPYRQTERFALYQQHAHRLLQQEAAYYCFCTPEELERERQRQLAGGGQPRYSGKCRGVPAGEADQRRAAGEPAAVRLKVRTGRVGFHDLVFGRIEVDCAVIGDPILQRSDGSPNYNFAAVIDDALMEISHVIRGEGHLSNTHRQLLIYEALGREVPRFAHLSTLLGRDGSKLSKRHGAASIAEFRGQGYLPEAMNNYLALLGWSPPEEGREILSLQEMVSQFSFDRVSKSPAIFDPEKLNWVNRSHLKQRSPAELVDAALPFLAAAGRIPYRRNPEVDRFVGMILEATLNHLDRLEQVVVESRLVFEFPVENLWPGTELSTSLTPEAIVVIESFSRHIDEVEALDAESYRLAVNSVKAKTGQKGKNLFHPIRVALTAEHSGPELERLIPILELGRKLALPARVLGARERLKLALEVILRRKGG
ncbi:MAG: glutamate--tRNA ligase [Acidobacteria bacterium]|nr:glutamate--tRNA ligase [Acidobacteriota bacterium]